MDGDLYLYADELHDRLTDASGMAKAIRDLALERNGPMTEEEKSLVRAYYHHTVQYLDDAQTALEAVKDATDFE